MVFLRKLLATGNRDYQQFALNMWCTYLEGGFEFDEQQEVSEQRVICCGVELFA